AGYDWANSTFATTVMAGFFPIFFKSFWHAGQADAVSTLRLGVGSSVASLIVLLLAPMLGAIADYGQRKKMFLAWTTGVGVLATAEKHFLDRKSTRLNSSHVSISYAVFCLKRKNNSPLFYGCNGDEAQRECRMSGYKS